MITWACAKCLVPSLADVCRKDSPAGARDKEIAVSVLPLVGEHVPEKLEGLRWRELDAMGFRQGVYGRTPSWPIYKGCFAVAYGVEAS